VLKNHLIQTRTLGEEAFGATPPLTQTDAKSVVFSSATLRLNILETKRDTGLVCIKDVKEIVDAESNDHVTDDVM